MILWLSSDYIFASVCCLFLGSLVIWYRDLTLDLWLPSKKTDKLQNDQVGSLTEDKGMRYTRDRGITCNDRENVGRIFILHGRNGRMEFDFKYHTILYNEYKYSQLSLDPMPSSVWLNLALSVAHRYSPMIVAMVFIPPNIEVDIRYWRQHVP